MREIKVSKETEGILNKIATLKACSVEEAAQIVLERYADRAKNQIETAFKTADRLNAMK
jgi:hypothetical protein